MIAFSVIPAASAAAQDDTKSLTVTFASASATSNGYVHGTVRLRYRFTSCGDAPQLYYSMEQGSAQGYEGYWYEGHMYGLQASWRPPTQPALDAEMRVRFNASPINVAPLHDPYAGPVSCFSGSQFRVLGKWADFTSKTMTREEALKRFDFDVGITRAPMRNPNVESAIRAQIAAARTDSIQRARAAAEQARRDSIARARSAAPTTTTPAVAGGTLPATATGATTPTRSRDTTTLTPAQREAAARAEEQRQADERARAVLANLEAQQAAQEAQNEQIEAAAMQVAGMVNSVLEQRRIDQERKAAREAAAAERYRLYQNRVAKVFAAMPRRPLCTSADTAGQVTVGSTITGTILGSECRLADSTSARMYTMRIDRKQMVRIRMTSNFYPTIRLGSSAGGVKAADSLEQMFEPGEYAIVIAPRLPGETGNYSVVIDKGTLSRTNRWSIGMYLGTTSGDFEGAAETPELGTVGGFRFMGPLNDHFHLVADAGNSEDGNLLFANAGLRLFLGSRTSAWRPLLEWTYGWRELFVNRGITGESYSGMGNTFAGGLEWFVTPQLGLELMLAAPTGTLDLKSEDKVGAPPTVGYAQTAFRFGMMFHR